MKEKKFISKEERVIYYIVSTVFIVDFINGYLIEKNIDIFSFGMVIRLGILFIYSSYILKYNYKKLLFIYMIFMPLFINSGLSYFFNHQTTSGFIFDIKDISKLIYIILSIETLRILYKNEKIRKKTIYSAILNNSKHIIFILGISIIFEIGNSTYGDVGYKSTYQSVNALNASLIVLFVFTYGEIYKHKYNFTKINSYSKFIENTYQMIIVLLFLIMTGTKSSLIFPIVIMIMYYILSDDSVLKTKQFIMFIAIGICILISIDKLFYEQFVDIIQRQMYFIDLRSENFMSYILSGRNEFLVAAYDSFKQNFSIRRLIFGTGSYLYQLEIGTYFSTRVFKNIEMEIFDFLFGYGIYGVLITFGYMGNLIIRSLNRYNIKEKLPYLISILMMLIFSTFGGHVLLDAMPSTLLVTCIATFSSKANFKL